MTTNEDVLKRLEAAVMAMTQPDKYRFDVTIICTTDDHQAEFWMSKLSERLVKSSDDSKFPMILAVSEDWAASSGAGNGLGTLYAWQKAVKYAKEKFGDDVDLNKQLLDGSISASLYHTAGKGTRMAPLPASENNNKPGVVRCFGCRRVVFEANCCGNWILLTFVVLSVLSFLPILDSFYSYLNNWFAEINEQNLSRNFHS